MLARADVEFSVQEGKRPAYVACEKCGHPVKVPKGGRVPTTCRPGAITPCGRPETPEERGADLQHMHAFAAERGLSDEWVGKVYAAKYGGVEPAVVVAPSARSHRSACRVCGHRGHFTKTCEKYAGQTFADWTVVRGAACPQDRPMTTYVLARCVCGVEKTLAVGHLKSGASKSCGCSRVGLATKGEDLALPASVAIFGASLSVGELARLARRKVEHVWGRLRLGMSPEEAALGR